MQTKQKTIFLTASLIILFDQITKYLTRQYISQGENIQIIPKILYFSFYKNTGAGFSILQDQVLLLSIISIAVIAYILYSIKKIPKNDKLMQISVAFILGGAIGNLIDRIVFKYVTDFINFQIWPVFNIADSFLTIGVAALIIALWNNDKKSSKNSNTNSNK